MIDVNELIRELKLRGSTGLDLSPGDHIYLQAARVIENLLTENAHLKQRVFELKTTINDIKNDN